MGKIMDLNGLIYGQFPNQAAFARHIKWRRQRLNKIVNGSKVPTLDEVQELADGLGVPFMMVCGFFLKKKSPND